MSDDNVTPIRPLEVIADVGGPIDETRVSLGIFGDDLQPEEVSALLGCSPTSCHRRGDSRQRGVGPWPSGAWVLSEEGNAPIGPEELLISLLSKLPVDPAVWSELNQRFTVRLQFGLFLNAWNRGFDLSPVALRRVAAVGAALGFDIYAEGDEADA